MRHSDLDPLLAASRQPTGFGRSAAQIEYCSSSFTTTLYFVSSVSTLFIVSPLQIRSVASSCSFDRRDRVAPVLCTPPVSPRESRHSVYTPWSRDCLERAERPRHPQPNHSSQASRREDFPRGPR